MPKQKKEFNLKIHGRTWRVAFENPEDNAALRSGDNYGTTDRSRFRITISDKECPQQQAVTFFHEFTHAVKTIAYYNQPTNEGVAEEVDCDLMGFAIVEFLEQKKEMPPWFKKIVGLA